MFLLQLFQISVYISGVHAIVFHLEACLICTHPDSNLTLTVILILYLTLTLTVYRERRPDAVAAVQTADAAERGWYFNVRGNAHRALRHGDAQGTRVGDDGRADDGGPENEQGGTVHV